MTVPVSFATRQAVDGGPGDGLGGLEPLLVSVEAEIDRRAELREAHHLGPVSGGLAGEVLGFLDIDVLIDVSTELGKRDPNGHRILLGDGQARLLYRRRGHCARGTNSRRRSRFPR